jgi:hypothetical protein
MPLQWGMSLMLSWGDQCSRWKPNASKTDPSRTCITTRVEPIR